MQIADLGLWQLGYHLADLCHQRRIHLGIQQHPAGVAQQPPGPHCHQHGAHYAHQGVEPVGPPQHAPHQRQNRQHRGGRIRQHVDVGGAQVEILMAVMIVMVMMILVVMIMMVVVVMAVVMMAVIVLKQPGTGQVHQQADDGDGDGLLIVDRAGIQQPEHRLEQHHAGHPHQQEGAGEAPQHLDLPGAEAESVVAGEVAGGAVGQHRQAERQRMGTHVPAVGQQRHGVVEPAATDLRHHHDDGQQHGPAGLLFRQRIPFVDDGLVAVG